MKNRMEPSEVNVDILKSYIRNNFVVKSISVWLAKIKNRKKNLHLFRHAFTDSQTFFEGNNSIGENSIVRKCHIGLFSYIGNNNNFCKIFIGRFCSIGSNVNIIKGKHPSTQFVSTHPLFFSNRSILGYKWISMQKFKEFNPVDLDYDVKIGNDVWIGDNVSIAEGVRIGHGAIIGHDSVVIKDIEPYSINVGIPSSLKKYRFEKDEVNYLLNFEWWNRELDWIHEHVDCFEDIKTFIGLTSKQDNYDEK